MRALVAVCLLAGCRQILGIDEREVTPPPDTHGTGKCGGFDYPSSVCAACMDQNCCDELNGCLVGASCEAHLSCAMSCPNNDPSCRTSCTWTQLRRPQLHNAPLVCRAQKCAADCGLSCGGLEYVSSACDDCARQKCCGKAEACAASLECMNARSLGCIPGDDICEQQRENQNPKGYPLYKSLKACLAGSCGVVCAEGTSWECLDKPTVPLAPKSSADITLSYRFLDFLSYAPLAGLEVKACRALDYTCSSEVDKDTSLLSGNVGLLQFRLPPSTMGFDGYLEVPLGQGDAGTYPGVAYVWTAPLVEDAGGALRWPSNLLMNAMAKVVGVTLDPSKGHIGVNTSDCAFALAGGVSLAIVAPDVELSTKPGGPGTTQFYFKGQVPIVAKGSNPGGMDAPTATDGVTAIGGFVNIPVEDNGEPRVVTIRATYAKTGQKVADRQLIVRPGTLTFAFIQPRD